MGVLSTLSLACCGLYLLIQAARWLMSAIYVARRKRIREEARCQSDVEKAVPSVLADNTITILQPILSGDPTLEDTLLANVARLPAEVHFIWLVDDSDAEGFAICQRLATKYLNTQNVYCDPVPDTVNPKTYKLDIGLKLVKSRYCAVLDDDTIIGPESLNAAFDSLQNCDLYTGLPLYRKSDGKWSNLVVDFVNSQSVLTYLAPLAIFQPLSINGMFFVFDTEKFRKIDGFAPILSELCDDYAVKKHVGRFGWKIEQGVSIQLVGTHVPSREKYFQLLHRWTLFGMLLVRDQPIHIQAILFVMLGLPPFLLAGAIIFSLFGLWSCIGLVIGLLFRHAIIRAAHRLVNDESPSLRFGGSIVSEMLQPVHIIFALISPKVRWRSRYYRARFDGAGTFESLSNEGCRPE